MVEALGRLIAPDTRGDPISPLRWTCKSTRHPAEAPGRQGLPAGRRLVGELLHHLGYSPQADAKSPQGEPHPDRDARSRHINDVSGRAVAGGRPVISVDTKKEGLAGPYGDGGREGRPAGDPERALTHDLPDPGVGEAIPYGVHDMGWDRGWVDGGVDHGTPSFAVESLRRWWSGMGEQAYPGAGRGGG